MVADNAGLIPKAPKAAWIYFVWCTIRFIWWINT